MELLDQVILMRGSVRKIKDLNVRLEAGPVSGNGNVPSMSLVKWNSASDEWIFNRSSLRNFSCCCDKIPWQNICWNRVYYITMYGCSSSVGNEAGRNLKNLDTLSWVREKRVLMSLLLSFLSLVYSVQDLNLPHGASHCEGGSSPSHIY